MVRMERAINQFNRTIDRGFVSIKLYRFLRQPRFIRDGKNRSINHSTASDLLRSAVVLSVSAMDAYFTDKFSDLLVPYLKKKGATKDEAPAGDVAHGYELFKQHKCASCHWTGSEGGRRGTDLSRLTATTDYIKHRRPSLYRSS